jgi:hypothetical protein
MTEESIYLSLKHAQAAKTGQHSIGQISYRVLADELHQNLFITIVGNEGGGWYSNEIVAFSKIEELLLKLDTKNPLSTKAFAPAFNSKSVNNAGFLAAVLRAEGLLNAAAEASRLHLVTNEWELWKSMMLTETGEVYVPPLAKGITAKAEKVTEPNVESGNNGDKTPLKLKISKKATTNITEATIEPKVIVEDTEAETDAETATEDEILEDADADSIELN